MKKKNILEDIKRISLKTRASVKKTSKSLKSGKTIIKSSAFVRFPLRDQMLFAKRLSFLIKAGVPVLESLYILQEQMKSSGTKRVFDRVIYDVSNGKFLSTSLDRFKNVFGVFAINIIRVGESSGILSQNLEYLAEELKKKEALRKKVLGALVYPIFITIATLGITALLTVFIFPKILPIFSSLNVALPASTKALISISFFLKSWGILTFLLFTILVIILVILHKKASFFRYLSDRLLIHIPIAGRIAKNYNMANFCRTLGILLKSGITVTESITITAQTTSNAVYKYHYSQISKRVLRGENMSRYLTEHKKVFPPIMTHMIAIGEKTGKLSDTLMYLSELYENEVEDMTNNLSNSIEPILMIIMGIIVGFVAVSVITPIYEITKGLQV